MQIVIDIPEEAYKQIIEAGELDYLEVITAIENGILLPKGHGRLIDEDCVILSICQQHCAEIFHSCRYNCCDVSHIVKAQTVIEADENREIKFKYN